MVQISKGIYKPFFDRSKKGKSLPLVVQAFQLDVTPVTNSDYLEFVKKNTRWRRSKVKDIFAEDGYLMHWSSDTSFRKGIENKAVSNVSWFAASSYCQSLGKSLPTTIQWEYVGSADETNRFAIGTKKYKQKILAWYGQPTVDPLPDVGQQRPNIWGVKDMHGLQWEWTTDFNTALVTGESREDLILDRNKFCGSGSLNAKDKLDYGAFMRFGFRSSLKGNYTINSLGFRCAKKGGKK